MNPNLTSFSYKDLLLRKLYYAVTCSVFSQIIILQMYLAVVNINIYAPTEWFSTTFATLTSFSTWLFILPFMLIIFAQCVICAKDYVLNTTYSSTRFQKIMSMFSLHNFIVLVLHVLVAVAQIWLLLSLAGGTFGGFYKSKSDEETELVEEVHFLLLGSLWTGFYFYAKIYISGKHLMFPVINQRKIIQFKSSVYPLLKESFLKSMWPSLYYITFYYLWGHELKNHVSQICGLSYGNAFSSSTYLFHWFFATLYFFNMNLIKLFFGIFLTEPVEFPIIKQSENILTMQESLNLESLPIVQSLACQDLYLLSMWSQPRRAIFYTLSQPGGHPHNWNKLVESVLKLYNDYTTTLNKSTESIIVKETKLAAAVHVQCTPLPQGKFRYLRNMTMNSPEPIDVVNITHQNMNVVAEVSSKTLEKLKIKVHGVVEFLKTILGINFFFGEIPQANIQKCLGNGHLIIWTCQAISELVTASLKEDRYGIVQKDIPVIVTSLVNLKQSLDKLNQVPALSKRNIGYDDINYKSKGAINSAVKRSLFCICIKFKDYLDDIPLSKDVRQYLQTSVLCKL